MLGRWHGRGLTLIELLVALAVLAVLLLLGLPSLSAFQANSKIRDTAQALAAGLQQARAESIRNNGGVEFLLFSNASANVDTPSLSSTGPHWMLRSLAAGSTSTYTLLESHLAFEGSQSANATPLRIASSTAVAGQVAFDGLGATVPSGATAEFVITHPLGGNCVGATTPGPMRCLRVQVSAGGQVRLCDPAVTAAGDPRTCS